jgi:hypothetical protein
VGVEVIKTGGSGACQVDGKSIGHGWSRGAFMSEVGVVGDAGYTTDNVEPPEPAGMALFQRRQKKFCTGKPAAWEGTQNIDNDVANRCTQNSLCWGSPVDISMSLSRRGHLLLGLVFITLVCVWVSQVPAYQAHSNTSFE